MKALKIQIKSLGGSVLFEYKCTNNTIKKTLEKAVAKKTNLGYANLRYADLRSANLRYADLRSANLRYADLGYADLRSANLGYANLGYADLDYAKGIKINLCMLNILRYQKGKLRAFKYLNGNSSPYQNFKYEVGKTYKEAIKDCDKNEGNSCGRGLNVATLEWCLQDTNFDLSKTYVEVEFNVKDIVAIPFASDGKFRVCKFKILRKIPEKELKKLI